MTTWMAKALQGQVFLFAVLSIAGTTRGVPPRPSAFFCFGDSYADTGNQNHNSSSWKYPYGITWPGYPTGRFGSGHIQTDYLADKLGLPSPTPYVISANYSIATGVNFAIGGSGVTFAIGVLPLGSQLDLFELVLRTGAYSPSFLADSVTLVSNVGNDYTPRYTKVEHLTLIPTVVEGMTLALERMYNLGLRNILVSNLPPINCFPGSTVVSNYSTCLEDVVYLIDIHNTLLVESVKKLNALPNANILILDERAAFTYVQDNPDIYGFRMTPETSFEAEKGTSSCATNGPCCSTGIKEVLIPCCRPLNATDNCGDVDLQGNPRYTLCDDPSLHVYWDTVHVVESTWRHVVQLFYNKTGFLIGETTLESWLYKNSLRAPAPSPAPELGVPQEGAVGQLEAAYQALISITDYVETLGLLQAIDFDEYLAGKPNQIVTVFLPSNAAYYTTNYSTIMLIYGQAQELPLAECHVVEGYYDSTRFPSSVQNLSTISGLDLLITPRGNETLVGPRNAMVVAPDLYKMEGQVVVHGINGILLPPGLQ